MRQLSQPRPLYGQNQHSSKFFRCRVGTLLRTRASEHFVLDQQFIHKSLQLVVRDTEELTMTLILNRHASASATMVSINAKGVRSPIKKHVFFGGPSSNNTSWWLCVQPAGTISVYSEGVCAVLASSQKERKKRSGTGGVSRVGAKLKPRAIETIPAAVDPPTSSGYTRQSYESPLVLPLPWESLPESHTAKP